MPELIAGGRTTGRFGTVQLVAIELAALAGIAAASAAFAAPRAAAGLAAFAAVVAVFALSRSGGRWAYESMAARLHHRLRFPPRAGGLATLATDLSFTTITDRGTAIGVGRDELGWFAAVAITAPSGKVVLRLDWLTRLLSDFTVPVSTLHLVTRQVPLAGPLDARTDCAMSYRELLGATQVPANREIWLAVRLAPADAAAASAGRGGGVEGVHRALAAAVARIGTALTAAEVNYAVLDAVGLQRILAIACGLLRPAPVAERWAGWHAVGFVHVGFAVRSWPADPPAGLLAELAQVPAAATAHTAIVLQPRQGTAGGRPVMRTLLRVTAPPELIGECVRQALANARRLRVRLVRLDGEHAAAVWATAPTGAVKGLTPW